MFQFYIYLQKKCYICSMQKVQMKKNINKNNLNSRTNKTTNKKKSDTVPKKNIIQKNKNEYIRLNKYIAESGVASRRKADELIASGVVKVNKKVVVELGTMVHLSDFITVKGDPISVSHRYIYILLNKPKNCITSTSDEKNRKTVMDFVQTEERIFPVGRLDRNTTGVLLLTNDGELANCLTHPRYQIARVYNAKLDKVLRATDAQKIAEGVDIGDGIIIAPCEIFIHTDERSKVTITLTEGKNHEVKKIFEAVGYEVKSLDRKYYHNLSTKGLARGKYRYLEKTEIAELRKVVNSKTIKSKK
jgi:23S rRNA pseudouridine2605 synthase